MYNYLVRLCFIPNRKRSLLGSPGCVVVVLLVSYVHRGRGGSMRGSRGQ